MAVTDGPSTRERVVEVALSSFAARGFEATSLDDVAAELGVTKQTVLYYHPSKDALLGAVIERSVAELAGVLRAAGRRGVERGDPLQEVVDALFRIGAQRPELLELVREALRLGPPASTRLTAELSPLLDELAGGVPRGRVHRRGHGGGHGHRGRRAARPRHRAHPGRAPAPPPGPARLPHRRAGLSGSQRLVLKPARRSWRSSASATSSSMSCP